MGIDVGERLRVLLSRVSLEWLPRFVVHRL